MIAYVFDPHKIRHSRRLPVDPMKGHPWCGMRNPPDLMPAHQITSGNLEYDNRKLAYF